MQTIELNLAILISLAALVLSTIGIMQIKKKNDNDDLKKVTTTLATLVTKVDNIEDAVLGKPTLSEQVAVNTQKINEHDRRLNTLEKCKELRKGV